jgi:hypothetical protein
MAGTISITSRVKRNFSLGDQVRLAEVITIDWVGDAANGTVPALSIPELKGFLRRAVTNPGSTAPTDNYDIVIRSSDDSTADVLNGALADRDTANTEVVIPTTSILFTGETHSLAISNTSVNSATGRIILVVSEE